MRCDVNISLLKEGSEDAAPVQGERVELKNVMGIKFIEKSIEHEVRRHAHLLSQGKPIIKETRRFDAIKNETFSLRSKEEDLDYRFLVDPDLPTFTIKQELID